ncbi:hypothetical protein EVAR_87007_1 [Eumeta japonica]|uniref:Uncharacterized protein n=1 Tax=Eumeta variegata TaxID=151549 RepID=A0A4C1W6W2_EUMVA|nr:hypothetical protein EVAR_87007_1 [Eumeta japonica]
MNARPSGLYHSPGFTGSVPGPLREGESALVDRIRYDEATYFELKLGEAESRLELWDEPDGRRLAGSRTAARAVAGLRSINDKNCVNMLYKNAPVFALATEVVPVIDVYSFVTEPYYKRPCTKDCNQLYLTRPKDIQMQSARHCPMIRSDLLSVGSHERPRCGS